jgi:triosephosphate isomerase
MKPIVIANWKMQLDFDQAAILASKLELINHNAHLIIAPPIPYLGYLATIVNRNSLCAQNISVFEGFGAITGEYSAAILKKCNVRYSIIGHSERRIMLNEQDSEIHTKLINCHKSSITPILCIGEGIGDHKNNNTRKFLLNQLKCVPADMEHLILAYEPIWAIGNKSTLTLGNIQHIIEVVDFLCSIKPVAKKVQLVYGGSITSGNFLKIMQIKGIEGVIIGSSSLKLSELEVILQQTAIGNFYA